jgi:hypothetical protein
MEVGRRDAGGREDGVNVGFPATVTPLGDIPDRRRGICEERLKERAFSVADGFPQGRAKLRPVVTDRAS